MKQNLLRQASGQFRRLRPAQQYGLTIFVVGLLIISWLLVYYLRTNEQIGRYQQEIRNFQQQRRTLSDSHAAIKDLTQSTNRLKLSLNKLIKPDTQKNQQHYQERITTIADLANKNGLTFESCTTKTKKIRDWFSKQNIVYSTVGTVAQINTFINAIKKNEHAAKCKYLSFNKNRDANARFDCTLQLLNFG